jgi:hypothetical protein
MKSLLLLLIFSISFTTQAQLRCTDTTQTIITWANANAWLQASDRGQNVITKNGPARAFSFAPRGSSCAEDFHSFSCMEEFIESPQSFGRSLKEIRPLQSNEYEIMGYVENPTRPRGFLHTPLAIFERSAITLYAYKFAQEEALERLSFERNLCELPGKVIVGFLGAIDIDYDLLGSPRLRNQIRRFNVGPQGMTLQIGENSELINFQRVSSSRSRPNFQGRSQDSMYQYNLIGRSFLRKCDTGKREHFMFKVVVTDLSTGQSWSDGILSALGNRPHNSQFSFDQQGCPARRR